MNYYERHLGDYARDTGHLTMLEHGAYTLLLDRYYATEHGIPEDQALRVARARSDDERAAVTAVLTEFFSLVKGVWIHGRVEAELEHARGRIAAARTNGRKGGRPRKNPVETQPKPNGFSVGSEMETQPKAHQAPSTTYPSGNETSLSGDADGAPARVYAGGFEGHAEPRPTDAPTRARIAVVGTLRRLGIEGATAFTDDLRAYVEAGGSAEHVEQVAAFDRCRGKGAIYVLRAARSDLTQRAPDMAPSDPPGGRALVVGGNRAAAPMSKTLQAVAALEKFK